jgi:hypothetical protein
MLDASVSKKSANLGAGHDISKDKSINMDASVSKKSAAFNPDKSKSQNQSRIREGTFKSAAGKSQLDHSVMTALNNGDYLLQSLIKLKNEQSNFAPGELIGLTKLTITEIIILKAPSFRPGIDLSGKDPNEYIPEESRKLID